MIRRPGLDLSSKDHEAVSIQSVEGHRLSGVDNQEMSASGVVYPCEDDLDADHLHVGETFDFAPPDQLRYGHTVCVVTWSDGVGGFGDEHTNIFTLGDQLP